MQLLHTLRILMTRIMRPLSIRRLPFMRHLLQLLKLVISVVRIWNEDLLRVLIWHCVWDWLCIHHIMTVVFI